MTAEGTQHAVEVARGERFEFGKNWARFLRELNDDRIAAAEKSLRSYLGVETLQGKTFIDIGSGSGLFSLVARRLGAEVASFDYDPYSVSCTAELRRRYFPDDPKWRVLRGSVLDKDFMAGFGQYDIVYSWGVLHHTGSMWAALENVKPLVRDGGRLFIAIYNDQGAITDWWARVKKFYCSLPAPLALAYACTVVAREEAKTAAYFATHGGLGEWVRTWTNYGDRTERGMSRWHDWIDWIGGWPYERATLEQIADFYAKDGFALQRINDRSDGYGCNEFVFERKGGPGEFIAARLPGGNTFARKYGIRLLGPAKVESSVARLRLSEPVAAGGEFHLMMDRKYLGLVDRVENGEAVFAEKIVAGIGADAPLYLMKGKLFAMPGPIDHRQGHMWRCKLPQYSDYSDGDETPRRSTLFILEDDIQLPLPHCVHAEIAKRGHGRFSYWREELLFSSGDGRSPEGRLDQYRIFLAEDLSKR